MGFRSLRFYLFPLLLSLHIGALLAAEQVVWREPTTSMAFIQIPAGCFNMGNRLALEEEVHYRLQQLGFNWPRFTDETPVHQVCLDAFWIGRFEVSATQWQALMAADPAHNTDQDPVPIAGLSWQQVQQFLNRLNQNAERIFRLPTEAEWEYACRGGEAEEPDYTLNPGRTKEAWYSHNDHKRLPQGVGQLTPNGWGLYDMLGNVWEWTDDNYSIQAYLNHSYKNPRLLNESKLRVIRGGSHRSEHRYIRCSARGQYAEDQALPHIGFRVVMEEAR